MKHVAGMHCVGVVKAVYEAENDVRLCCVCVCGSDQETTTTTTRSILSLWIVWNDEAVLRALKEEEETGYAYGNEKPLPFLTQFGMVLSNIMKRSSKLSPETRGTRAPLGKGIPSVPLGTM